MREFTQDSAREGGGVGSVRGWQEGCHRFVQN